MAASPKEKFDAAVRVIQTLPKNGSFVPSHSMMLKFYGYYKQATQGPCNIPRPGFWDVVGKAKWDAWSKLGDLPREEAMTNYVGELKQVLFVDYTHGYDKLKEEIVEAMPHTQMVQDFVEKLDNFYELVGEGKVKANGDVPRENGESDSVQNGDSMDSNNENDLEVESITSSSTSALKRNSAKKPPFSANGSEDNNNSPSSLHSTPIRRRNSFENDKGSLNGINLDGNNHHSSTFLHNTTVSGFSGEEADKEDSTALTVSAIIAPSNTTTTIAASANPTAAGRNRLRRDDEDDDEGTESSDGEFCDTQDSPQIQREQRHESTSDQTYVKSAGLPVHDHTYSTQGYTGEIFPSHDHSLLLQQHSDWLYDNQNSAHFNMAPPYGAMLQGPSPVEMRGGGENFPSSSRHREGSVSSVNSQSRGAGHSSSRRTHLAGGQPGRSDPAGGSGGASGGGGGGGHQQPPPPAYRPDVNQQIAMALMRLQQDMSSVLTRLNTLETLTVAQHHRPRSRTSSGSQDASHNAAAARGSPWWWPFGAIEARTVFFILVWPLIVNWVLRILSRRRNRRR